MHGPISRKMAKALCAFVLGGTLGLAGCEPPTDTVTELDAAVGGSGGGSSAGGGAATGGSGGGSAGSGGGTATGGAGGSGGAGGGGGTMGSGGTRATGGVAGSGGATNAGGSGGGSADARADGPFDARDGGAAGGSPGHRRHTCDRRRHGVRRDHGERWRGERRHDWRRRDHGARYGTLPDGGPRSRRGGREGLGRRLRWLAHVRLRVRQGQSEQHFLQRLPGRHQDRDRHRQHQLPRRQRHHEVDLRGQRRDRRQPRAPQSARRRLGAELPAHSAHATGFQLRGQRRQPGRSRRRRRLRDRAQVAARQRAGQRQRRGHGQHLSRRYQAGRHAPVAHRSGAQHPFGRALHAALGVRLRRRRQGRGGGEDRAGHQGRHGRYLGKGPAASDNDSTGVPQLGRLHPERARST